MLSPTHHANTADAHTAIAGRPTASALAQLLARVQRLRSKLRASNGPHALPSANRLHQARESDAQFYAQLFSVLRTRPRYLAALASVCSLSEMEPLVATVMQSVYANHWDSREEVLLLGLLKQVLEIEFISASEFGSLMRANSPLSRMLTAYTRRQSGNAYLRKIVSRIVGHVTDLGSDFDLELNSAKFMNSESDSTAFTLDRGFASGHEEPAPASPTTKSFLARVASRHSFHSLPSSKPPSPPLPLAEKVQTLCTLVETILEEIYSDLEEIPFGIRWICKQIWSLAETKYPHESPQTRSSLLGGLFFLRYINPALLFPEPYLVATDPPLSTNQKRTLTLVAKIIQNLANNPSTVKESYMAPLAPFLEAHQTQTSAFFMSLCAVDYTLLQAEEVVAMACGVPLFPEMVLQIGLNEARGMHTLLLRHLDSVAPEGQGGHVAAFRALVLLFGLDDCAMRPDARLLHCVVNVILPANNGLRVDVDSTNADMFVQILAGLVDEGGVDLDALVDGLRIAKDAVNAKQALVAVSDAAWNSSNKDLVLLGVNARELLTTHPSESLPSLACTSAQSFLQLPRAFLNLQEEFKKLERMSTSLVEHSDESFTKSGKGRTLWSYLTGF
ncbi:Rho GTPase activation protein [Chytriomyces sp. MP71]|nr:Rho GTPase activation protein [Chytriomyces sp. MP71]